MAYCGCATKANKIKWAIAIATLIIGLALLLGGIISSVIDADDYLGLAKCRKWKCIHADCLRQARDDGNITEAEYNRYKRDDDGPIEVDDLGETGNVYVDKCENDWKDTFPGNAAMFWLGIVFLIVASIPCYVMCCCTKKPQEYKNGVAYATPVGTTYATPGYAAPQTTYGTPAPPYDATIYANPNNNVAPPYGQPAPPAGYPQPQV